MNGTLLGMTTTGMTTGTPSLHLLWIPLLPFLGFLINGTIGRRLSRGFVTAVALISTGLSLALVANILLQAGSIALPHTEFVAPWISAGFFHADFAFTVDQLTMVFLCVITGVGFLIHLYSVGYMAHEEGFWRFFAYLNLFMFFMLTLVLAQNFLLMFVGWEGVGLASYLLIGFYFDRDSAADAGKKAFVVNRIGDFGFLLGMFLIIQHFGTLSFSTVFAALAAHPALHGGWITAICICLLVGAAGKSAQIPLYVWLPDAMEGPTPVSALIHAATMVTAGVYMVARAHPLYDRSPAGLETVAIIGAATCLFAATMGMLQFDIKRVLAYSTVSQLGYMFLACGVASYSSGIFHVVTHAFFKALLFLAAGSVIHALSGEQDMRVMGGLRKKIPITFWTMTAGVFAISGIPPFAGFFSKDEILYQTFNSTLPGAKILWFIGLFTAGLTAFYMFRLWFMTFFGAPRYAGSHAHTPEPTHHSESSHGLPAPSASAHSDHGHHGGEPHESPWVMLLPLILLAIASTIGGAVLGWPGEHNFLHNFLSPVLAVAGAAPAAENPGLEGILAVVSVLTGLAGLFAAWLFYVKNPALPAQTATRFRGLYELVYEKYRIDELYDAVFVKPTQFVSRYVLAGFVDGGLISGTAFGLGAGTRGLGSIARRFQGGNIRSYAGWLAFGAALLLVLTFFGFGTHMVTR
jgi:NADH-quinone oxidoreductase subunit L